MSLKKQFKTNSAAANKGVWFGFPEFANADGTVPAFLVARKTGQNKAYGKAMREMTLSHTDADGVYDEEYFKQNEAEAEALDLSIFLTTLLHGWRNFQPEDDGKPLDYTPNNANKIFGDPDWSDLRTDLMVKCSANTAYKAVQIKGEAKK